MNKVAAKSSGEEAGSVSGHELGLGGQECCSSRKLGGASAKAVAAPATGDEAEGSEFLAHRIIEQLLSFANKEMKNKRKIYR